MKFTRTVLLAAALAPFGAAIAQDWPAKPIRIIVPYTPGGSSDIIARAISQPLADALKTTVVVENKPGANGNTGTDLVAKSPADGYTLMTGDNGVMVFHAAMYKKIPYAPQDFAPVGFMAGFPLILAVNPNAGFSSARQLLDEVKKSPAKYSYASPGIGSPHHLAMELLKDRTRSFIVHVPYRGTALALQDVIGGQVPMMVLDTAAGLPQIRAGKVKALAVMSPKRLPTLPDVPTLDEIGVKGFDVSAWQGLFMPKDTPPEIVSRMTTEMTRAITVPEVKARLEDFGLEVRPTDGPALAAFIRQETAFWHPLIRDRKLSAD